MHDAVFHPQPFPFHTLPDALGAEAVAALRALFDTDLPWVRHESFYRCFMADIGDRLDPVWLAGLAAPMRALTGCPLTDRVTATAQRMEPGDLALPHTDEPRAGYEVARLIVQVEADWSPADGGCFHALASDDPTSVVQVVPPLPGSGLALVMTPRTWHAVTPTGRARRTVVFHFQHVGNTDAVADAVEALFADVRFAALPAALDPVATLAEATCPEEVTERAGLVAWALHRMGCADETVVDGYRCALEEGVAPADVGAASCVVLAGWLAHLHAEAFDVDVWTAHRDRIDALGAPSSGRPAALAALCFPAR